MTAMVLMIEDRFDGGTLCRAGERVNVHPELAMIWLSLGVAESVPADAVIAANDAAVALEAAIAELPDVVAAREAELVAREALVDARTALNDATAIDPESDAANAAAAELQIKQDALAEVQRTKQDVLEAARGEVLAELAASEAAVSVVDPVPADPVAADASPIDAAPGPVDMPLDVVAG
jgi:hypothetical protein